MDEQCHNAVRGYDDVWIFDNEDPQIIVSVEKGMNLKYLFMEYEIILSGLEQYECYLHTKKDKLQTSMPIQARQERQLVEQKL